MISATRVRYSAVYAPSIYFDLSTNRFLQALMNCWETCRAIPGYHCFGCIQIFSTLLQQQRWISTQGSSTCMKPKVGSRNGQQSSGTCPTPPRQAQEVQTWQVIAQVRVTRNTSAARNVQVLPCPHLGQGTRALDRGISAQKSYSVP